MKILLLIFLGSFQLADGECTFPSDISNSVWTTTSLGDITFGTTVAEFLEKGESTFSNWTCHVSSESKYVLQSSFTVTSASLGTEIYTYYCFDFHQQGTDSYLYYHPTAELGITGVRKLQLGTNTTTVTAACSESIDTAEYHVMVKKASASSVKNYCASPLLGNFLYSCSSGSTDNGTLNVCDTSSQQTLVFNHTQCTPSAPVIHSSNGVLNCVAKTSATVSSETVYYQTLYNTDSAVNDLTTFQFVCLAVTEDSNGTVNFSYKDSVCTAGQTSTTGTTFEPLTSTTLCRKYQHACS
ncbi:uncharacterized protein LOC123551333 [Mercenaria mercenaria]|uniref:uncharacterized protein LOC123551333 n=1 Tax=Mercenaria mercenaria TaxID=6596 RepID=UPI00234F7E9E|nr:uncharacterized protein LOC123551333 [Mercenaria mercenaria]